MRKGKAATKRCWLEARRQAAPADPSPGTRRRSRHSSPARPQPGRPRPARQALPETTGHGPCGPRLNRPPAEISLPAYRAHPFTQDGHVMRSDDQQALDLFGDSVEQIRGKAPLAERMRPRTLDEFDGRGGPRAGNDPPARGRTRRTRLDHPLGAARHRQDDPRLRPRPPPQARFVTFSAVTEGVQRRAGDPPRGRGAPPAGAGDDLLLRRDPPVQRGQQDAFLPPSRRGPSRSSAPPPRTPPSS